MSDEFEPQLDTDQPAFYHIRIKGQLGDEWTEWFAGLTVTQEENGETLLSGYLADQAALHGLLRKVRDLGIPLLSVARLGPDQADGLELNY